MAKLLENLFKRKYDLGLISLMFLSFVLKFVNLGYSNYQGDEIKALFLPVAGQSFWEFLISQRKGPLQFLVTYGLKFIDPTYTNELLIRLPFAIAAFFSVYFFYKFVKSVFNERIALFAAFFMATNGFFVAFSRIAQYQSLVIFFSVLTLYLLDKAIKDPKYEKIGVYLGLISWALGLLAHYDAIFIAPVVFWMLFKWFNKKRLLTFLGAGVISAALLLSFYIPFALSLSGNTLDYWEGRLSGTVSAKLSSSIYLFTVYQPIYAVHFYLGLFIVGVLALILSKSIRKYFAFIIWLVIPLFLWEQIVYIPGTHIYTYLMPGFIFMAMGIEQIEKWWKFLIEKFKVSKIFIIKDIFLVLFCTFIFLQSYAIFVDNRQEYPWQSEKFLIWTFPEPTAIYHLSMFGFPYFRDWEGIGNFVKQHPDVTAYSTNERESMSRYYVALPKSTDKAGFFVFIKNPQSFTNQILNDKASYWANRYPPVYTYSRNGNDLVNVYIMPTGTLPEIIEKGF